ncbi:MAG: MoxR family ATPase [Kofleriaceae bacterium]|nr:MoxR family ATPase [Myxococcales bacterium]MCB9558791.1 MoxR family ATPase [Kofleriaceae bacterium]MCB9570655.1 MoxR family ATPase [Kofleriaceae bacterium]
MSDEPESFDQFRGTDTYIASDELRHAVNVAVALSRPLLLRGEPGTGKTLLAENLAGALGLDLVRWHVKSTTKARDGLYVYDTVARLHDSRFGDGDVKDIAKYIKLGPMGEALSADHKVVLLIDEIDKADIEFPNDLLLELDAMRFHIDELGKDVVARERPVVVITSNNEKELPDAFLRRCVFHYIDFPDRALMERIVRVHHPDIVDRVLDQALEVFYGLRATPRMRKRPSTSELIDWICALKKAGVDLGRVGGGIPFLGTLLKTEQDVELVAKRAKA